MKLILAELKSGKVYFTLDLDSSGLIKTETPEKIAGVLGFFGCFRYFGVSLNMNKGKNEKTPEVT